MTEKMLAQVFVVGTFLEMRSHRRTAFTFNKKGLR
jgi:hypothetical protein